MEPSINDLLHVAVEAAHLGGKRTLAYFGTGVDVETKSNATPVTRADREAEAVIREHIGRYFPSHAILGEEEGATGAADAPYRWIVDPLDGTKSFVHGVPLYGTLIGVEVRGEVTVGVCYLPVLDEMVYAARGNGCWWNGRRAEVSKVGALAEATMCCTSPRRALARSDAYERLVAKTHLERGWGDCYGHVLVATGRAEVMLDPVVNPWDVAPFVPIMAEAGGRYTDWTGAPTPHAKDGVSTNGLVHEDVLAVLRSEKRRA